MPLSANDLLDLLSASGLPQAAAARAWAEKMPAAQRPGDGPALARLLVQQGLLTPFQANVIARGNPQPLVLDDYIILDKLGAGGMGTIFKAEHRRMKRPVALKVMAESALKSPDAIRRFQREVQAAAQLQHPNIVTAFDAREARGQNYLVMELVEGKDLGKVVKEVGPLPPGRALDYVLQAARGLAHAHAKGIIHRDIKPTNLLLDAQGTVKVLDMGLARVEGTEGPDTVSSDHTRAGTVLGTLDFMSPEQAYDTHLADARSDIYSLGCTLYFLITGKPPFGGNTTTQKILAHRDQPIPSLRALRPQVPQTVDDAFREMVAKKPQDRPPSMTAVVANLERCRAGLPPEVQVTVSIAAPAQSQWPAPVSDVHSATASLAASRVSRKRKLLILGAALAPFLIVGIWLVTLLLPNGGDGGDDLAGGNGNPGQPENNNGGDANGSKDKNSKLVGLERMTVEPGAALSPLALVGEPAKLKGVLSWTVETAAPRGGVLSVPMAYSADGRWLAIGGGDGTIRLWDCQSDKLHKVLVGAGEPVAKLAWSPDGVYLLARAGPAYSAGVLYTWEPATGRCWRSEEKYRDFALSSKGDKLAVVSGRRADEILILDFHTRRKVRDLGRRAENAAAVAPNLAWSADDGLLALASRDEDAREFRILVFDTGTGDRLRTLPFPAGHSEPLFVWSPRNPGQLAFSQGKTVVVKDMDKDKEIAVLEIALTRSDCLGWTADGRGLRTIRPGGGFGTAEFWDLATKKSSTKQAFRFGNNVWCPTRDESACFWSNRPGGGFFRGDLAGERLIFREHRQFPLRKLQWSPTGDRISLQTASLNLLDAATGKGLGEVGTNGQVLDACWNPDGTKIALILYQKDATTLQVRDLGNRKNFKEHPLSPAVGKGQVAWSADGKEVICADPTGSVTWWEPEKGKSRSLSLENWQAGWLGFLSPAGVQIASSDAANKAIKVWNTRTGKLDWQKVFEDTLEPRWSPDGALLTCVPRRGGDATKPARLIVLKAATGEVWLAPADPLGRFQFALASPNRSAILLGGVDLGFFDPDKNRIGLVTHRNETYAAASWSARSDMVACEARPSDLVEFRQAPSGRLLAKMEVFSDPEPYWLVVGADGHYRVEGAAPPMDMVYVVQTTQGQESLTPEEFQRRYGWKNDPAKVRLRAS